MPKASAAEEGGLLPQGSVAQHMLSTCSLEVPTRRSARSLRMRSRAGLRANCFLIQVATCTAQAQGGELRRGGGGRGAGPG